MLNSIAAADSGQVAPSENWVAPESKSVSGRLDAGEY